MLPDYYSVLGIPRNATYVEIKAAYRSLAKQHHPDKHGGSLQKEQLFKEINEAYSVLSHTDTKFSYDKRLAWQESNPQPVEPPTTYHRRPPVYSPPQYQPYQYAPRRSSYGNIQYVYSKWTLMYGKIFVVSLITLVVLFPIMLEYSFSNYYYNKGVIDLANNNFDEAENNFLSAMRDLGGSNTIAAIKLVEMNLADNRSFNALANIKMGLKFAVKTPYRARLYYLRGVAEQRLNHIDKAETAFNNALELKFDKDSVYTYLAPIYAFNLKEYTKAIALYDRLMIAEPTNINHYLNRGFCYQKQNNHQAAIDDFNYFMTNKGVNGSALFLKAISQISLEQIDSACINLRESKMLGIREAVSYLRIYCQPDSTKIVYPANPF